MNSRAVTADHILFDECIDAFRREKKDYVPIISGPSISYVLTAFKINQDWDLGICKVSKSEKVELPGAYSAFISTVKNPEWVGQHNPHLFGIALSTIVSFITQKPCKSTRDDYLCRIKVISGSELSELAINNPILTAGLGSINTSLSQESQDRFENEIKDFIELLNSLAYEKYIIAMQSIRLVYMSLINKREDFGLAYSLLISSIESVAQKSIKREIVKKVHTSEKLWKEKAKKDNDFEELLNIYKEARGNNQYIKERYIKFIEVYAPVENWEKYVLHPQQESADYIKEISPTHDIDYIVKKNWFEKYPIDLTETEIKNILDDTYTHRSCFIHRGEQPPHKDPSPSFNRFFQEYVEYKGNKIREIILPNYELLLGISKYSLLNWLKFIK